MEKDCVSTTIESVSGETTTVKSPGKARPNPEVRGAKSRTTEVAHTHATYAASAHSAHMPPAKTTHVAATEAAHMTATHTTTHASDKRKCAWRLP